MFKEKFGERFLLLAQEKNKSIRTIAKELDISHSALSYNVSGKKEIKIENLCKIADYFNVDLDYLCGRKDY